MKKLINSPVRTSRVMRVLCAVTMLCLAGGAAQAQQSFKSADEAVAALVAALRSDKADAIVAVLGRDSRPIVESGDPVADAKLRQDFLATFDLGHRLVGEGDGKSILTIGKADWPFPIPVVQRGGSWRFDTAAGRQEILDRRVGRNELSAIQVCLAFVDAQNEYASLNPEKTKVESYARRIVSSAGKKDGLYWPAAAGEPQSPLGDAMAAATAEGYQPGATPQPYHGYYYKVLTGQGRRRPAAPSATSSTAR